MTPTEIEAGDERRVLECEPMPAVTEDGWCEWVHPLPGYLMQCCDCGLVHEVEFAIVPRDPDLNTGPLNEGEALALSYSGCVGLRSNNG